MLAGVLLQRPQNASPAVAGLIQVLAFGIGKGRVNGRRGQAPEEVTDIIWRPTCQFAQDDLDCIRGATLMIGFDPF